MHWLTGSAESAGVVTRKGKAELKALQLNFQTFGATKEGSAIQVDITTWFVSFSLKYLMLSGT